MRESLADAFELLGVEPGDPESAPVCVTAAGRQQAVAIYRTPDRASVGVVIVGIGQFDGVQICRQGERVIGVPIAKRMREPDERGRLRKQSPPGLERRDLPGDETGVVVPDECLEGFLIPEIRVARVDRASDMGSTDTGVKLDVQCDAESVLDTVDDRAGALDPVALDALASRLEIGCRIQPVSEQIDPLFSGIDPEFDTVDDSHAVATDDRGVQAGLDPIVVGDRHSVESGLSRGCRHRCRVEFAVGDRRMHVEIRPDHTPRWTDWPKRLPILEHIPIPSSILYD